MVVDPKWEEWCPSCKSIYINISVKCMEITSQLKKKKEKKCLIHSYLKSIKVYYVHFLINWYNLQNYRLYNL